jgi:hypothetical protein
MEESGGTTVMVPLTESVLCARYIGGKGSTVGRNWHRILQQPLDARGKADCSRNGTLQSPQHNSYNTTTKMAQSCC